MSQLKFEVSGMHCPSCKMLITDILQDEGASIIKFDVNEKKQVGSLAIDTKLSADKIASLIQEAGEYKVKIAK